VNVPAGGKATATRGPIWLVRHAPTDWTGRRWCGRSDPELSDKGLKAAHQLALEFATDPVVESAAAVVILSSPLRRALDTAGPIAVALDAPIQVEGDLAEIDFGAADGLSWDELVLAHPALADAILTGAPADWPEGEAAVDVSARARSAADRIVELSLTAAVVVVTHAGVLSALTGYFGGEVPPGGFEPASVHRLNVVSGE
jgi:broad specificity phosphatase PhoE